ncbi:hypothetical protein E2320_009332 [Naja naja]|nr:hypothetical protein E2320_009332 [Naja naja]
MHKIEQLRHPEAFIDGLGSHNVVPRVGGDLPLRHGCADYDANPADESQDEAQHLEAAISHPASTMPQGAGPSWTKRERERERWMALEKEPGANPAGSSKWRDCAG